MEMKVQLMNTIILLLLSINKIAYAADMESYSLGKAILRLVFYITMTILVIVIAILGTRFLAKSGKRFITSKYMRIIDSLSIGTNLRVLAVQVKDYIYILAITNNAIEVLDKIPQEDFLDIESFEDHLSAYRDSYSRYNDFFNRIQRDMKRVLDRSSKVIDKEEGNDEKDS